MSLDRFNNSTFTSIFSFNDNKVIEWARNVFDKIKQDGVLPLYIEREKVNDIVNIDLDKATYQSSLEINPLFTFERCISGADIPLEHRVSLGTYHTIEFEVSNEEFQNFRILFDDANNTCGILIYQDGDYGVNYYCGGELLSFTPILITSISKIKLVRSNLSVSCYVDGVLIDTLSLVDNGEYACDYLVKTFPSIIEITATSTPLTSATGVCTITFDQEIAGLSTANITINKDSTPLVDEVDYILSGLTTTTPTITFLSHAALDYSSVLEVVIAKIGYEVNGGTPISIDNTILFTVKLGALYNWYAAVDIRKITSDDAWRVSTQSDYTTLLSYLGDPSLAGGKLKEVGTTYWQPTNTGATNEVGFNGRGSGWRDNTNPFAARYNEIGIWIADNANIINFKYFNTNIQTVNWSTLKFYGASIRLIKTSTLLSHGQAGLYVGNDGKRYRTICIGTQEWLADNLAETKFRNGDNIPEITDTASWNALITGAYCTYNNDPNNI